MLTQDIIKRMAPNARADYIDALVNGEETFVKWGFDQSLRLAALLATCAHETGGFRIVRENMNYSASRIRAVWPTRPEAVQHARNPKALANAVYGGRMGNEADGTNDDDGYRYRGGGFIQLTGKWSYEQAGKAIGVNLAAEPELIEDPKIALEAACWEMSRWHNYCDLGDRGWRSVCNAINRGNPASKLDPIGWYDRQIWYQKVVDALGISGKVEDDLLRIGDRGELVKVLQKRLNELGYAAGADDGIFGSRTRAAVLTFQAENKLTTDGIVGPETRAAMNKDDAAPMPLGDRAEDTVADLRDKGSRTIEKADKVTNVAVATGGLGLLTATFQAADALTGAGDLLKELNQLQTLTVGFTGVYNFFSQHWYLLVILVGYLLYRYADDIKKIRLSDHVSGVNLGR